ncbi:hypothetical protein G7046_g7010 [Stylonectria norvegica]|nr:hypothetical protein G7046_g7010 [Stylonectria norvegica]
MAPESSRRRRRADTDDEEDDDSARYADASQTLDSPKRPRLSSNDEDEPVNERPRPGNMNGITNGNNPNDFQPGAIVRVGVENFVTYENAEFFPGPHLNMVVGPNGTGKSSLVCAICLGLGYSPKHLGRAGSVKEFVKHGKDIATIEIELQKRPQDRRNYVIRVQIRREQNNQKWWLNGKETNHKSIQALMRKLKIQVDNLCQFLPQDRVVEFAASTPVGLLHETLRAAAPEEMLAWQSQLRDLHKDKKELGEAAHADADTLKNLDSRQQGLQADVDRIREREEIQRKAKDLKSALILAKYQEARTANSVAKERKKEAERSLRRLEEESGPSLEAVNQKQQYSQQIDAVIPGRKRALKDAEDAAKKLARDVSSATEAIKEFENKLGAEHQGFNVKKKDLMQSKTRITNLQADQKRQPKEFNAGEFNTSIRAEEHKMRELEAEKREVDALVLSIKNKGKNTTEKMRTLGAEIESLDTQQGQQLSVMRRQFPDAAAGWDWVQEHQDEFEKEVFGPPMISCSIKDERYSDQVQALLQVDDLTCFTAQTKNDWKKLTDQLYRVMSLSVVIRTCAHSLDAFRPPVGPEEAEQLSLDGFAINYLDGPAPILAMLCAEKRLHQSGVSLNEQNDAQYDQLVKGGKVNQWAAGKQLYTVRRRKEYGPQAMTAVTKNIQSGQFWTSQPIDTLEKAELHRRLMELRGERDNLKEQLREEQAKLQAIDDQRPEIENTIEQLRREKNTLQKEYQKWQSLPEKIGQYLQSAFLDIQLTGIESEERAKTLHEQALQNARKNMISIRYEWDEAVLKRADLTLKHKKAIERIRDAHKALITAQLMFVEAVSDIQGLKLRNADIMAQVDAEKLNVHQATEEANRTREQGRLLSQAVQELLATEPEKRELFSQLAQGRSSEDMVMEIDAEEAKLDLIHAANPNVVREFERRAGEIARLTKKMEAANAKLSKISGEIDELMAKWEPKLEELVSKINDAFAYNFEQISCAGEVRVHQDDDFDLWALDVMVRFRYVLTTSYPYSTPFPPHHTPQTNNLPSENETLQQLTAHRQSGGERAVSTIFYLMALQSMAQSPFRVVDEINQGMDPRNERMVHERMVEIACREHTSQYFLITPKLLTGLRYDPKMRVLCIASGEHMPRDGKKMDFKRCLRIQRGLMAAA